MTPVKSSPAPSTPGVRLIDRRSPIPLYYQLARILKEAIEASSWTPGDLLPSEADLGHSYAVSRPVVRKALEILESDGQVYKVNGKGTVVAAPKFRYEAAAAARDWNRGAAAGTWTLQRILDIRRASAGNNVGRLLQIDAREDVFEFSVVHAVDREPVSEWHAYLRLDASPGLAEVAQTGSLPKLIKGGSHAWEQLNEGYGIAPVRSELDIEATLVNEFESEVLGIAIGSPIFLLTSREIVDGIGACAFTRAVIRSDHFRYSIAILHSK